MKKLIARILAYVLIISLLSGCSWNPFSREKGPKTGPVGKWDMPIPRLNPLGSQNLYSGTEHLINEHNLSFVENYQEASVKFSGEMWRLMVKHDSKDPLVFLKKYAKKLGAKIYPSPYRDRVVFRYCDKKEPNVLWWGDAKRNDEGYELTVLKELHALLDKPLVFKPKELGNEVLNFSFATSSTGKKFQSITLNLPDGAVTATANLYMEKGVLSRSYNYVKELNSIKTNKFVLDDIPQGEGTLIWNFTWEQGKAPSEISFLLQELYDIPPVKMGDEFGTLKVSGAPFGSVRVEVPNSGTVEHADGYSLEGDITKEGDTLFWLPAGYWNVVLEADGVNLNSTKTRLVPVNAGEMTELKLPSTLKSTFSSLNSIYEEVETASEGIEIFKTKDLKDTAEISFEVHDPKKRDIFPNAENTKIMEGGAEVKILDIKRQGIPPSVVLLLDSSGSMKKEMAGTIEAAKKFVQGLPDNSFIQVIDFDSEARVLNGKTKSEVIKSLGTVKASGSTVLYDSMVKGIEILKDKERPTLVVFSDGKDSSHDPKDVGSVATKEEVIAVLKEAAIPLYTIGFGPSHDGTTLKEFAGISEGVYYPAKDQKALENVFAAINSKFGNLFTLTYERPKELPKADTPVVSIVMDNSGSMDTDPSEEGCGYRIDKVKDLFHNFAIKLPNECLTQMISFHTSAMGDPLIDIQQLTSNKKPELLQALGEMVASSGTPILDSITAAYENIKPVPTTKKVLVYMTDAALEVPEEEQIQFEKLLSKLKEDEIQVIWVGMGVQGKESVFKRAAELSNGRYVVTEDVAVLEKTLSEVLALINEPKTPGKTSLSININDETKAGDVMNYSASTMVPFSKVQVSGKAVNIDKVETRTGTVIKHYDKYAAELIYGTDAPSKEALISKRMALDSKGENSAMEIKVKEAFYFGILKGVRKPDGKQFLALDMELKNVTKEKIPYQIPSFNSHFYVGINGEGMYPASNATWLSNTPLAPPGEPMIQIEPGETIKGALIFLVPDEAILQESLHYYDTVYGHVGIPLVGKMVQNAQNVAKLPTEQPVDITDAFSMTIKGTSLEPKLDRVQAAENTSFRVIEAEFKTKVQALLDIEPRQRLYLSQDTAQGPLLTKMSEVTAHVPYGFMNPILLAPGSNTLARLAYQVPNALSNIKSDIIGDLRDGYISIPITKGNKFGTAVSKPKIVGDGMELQVNDLVSLGGNEKFGARYVVADITVFDKKDGFGTTGFESAFALVRNNTSLKEELANSSENLNTGEAKEASTSDDSKGNNETSTSEEKEENTEDGESAESAESDGSSGEEKSVDEEKATEAEDDKDKTQVEAGNAGLGNFASGFSSENILGPDPFMNDLLYAVTDEWAVFDGASRRGLIVFQIPEEETLPEWTLQSSFFDGLKLPIRTGSYGSSQLLVYKTNVESNNDEFEEGLSKAIQEAVSAYEMTRAASGGSFNKSVGLSTKEGEKNRIPTPSIVYSGLVKIKEVKNDKSFADTMKKLNWLPSKDDAWDYRYSKEAVLTQGWGNEWDLANLAEGLLSKLGCNPKRRIVKLTEEGKEKLAKLGGISQTDKSIMPALSYIDEKGDSKLFVIPFMKDITKLEDLAYMTANQEKFELRKANASISVSIKGESLDKTAATQISDSSNALAGGDGSDTSYEYIEMLKKDIPLSDMSMDAIDIGYVEVGKDKGDIYKVSLNTPSGMVFGEGYIDDGRYKILGVQITVSLPGQEALIQERTVKEGQQLKDIYQTIGINLPDLPKEAAQILETAGNKIYKGAKEPDNVSAMKWYSRSILNRFIANQSTYDEKTAKSLNVRLGRTSMARSIVVTASINPKDQKLVTSVDIMQGINEVHNGTKEAQSAYSIGAGIFLSQLEGRVIKIGEKVDLFEIWGKAPKEMSLYIVSDTDGRNRTLELLKASGGPEALISQLAESEKMFIIPDMPTVIDGEKRWAWLEIDPVTYQTISVIDTGEHGGMAEYVVNMMPSIEDCRDYVAGAFVGITTSVWAVAAFSLELDDYDEILKNAAGLVDSIATYCEYVMKGVDFAKNPEISATVWELSKGPCKFEFKVNHKLELSGESGHNFDLISGFKEGAAFYFKNARK